MKIAFYGDSLTRGIPGASYFRILKKQFPGYILLNYGKVNDTALSLYKRIRREYPLRSVEMAFLWIGINDYLTRTSPMASKLWRWWAQDERQFGEHYRLLLDLLTPKAGKLITVSPALAGEDLSAPCQEMIDTMGNIIGEMSAEYTNVKFVDMRAYFAAALGSPPVSDWKPLPLQSVIDAMALRTPAQIDLAAAQRGLKLTIDGVHLNNEGAALAAGVFRQMIEAERNTLTNII